MEPLFRTQAFDLVILPIKRASVLARSRRSTGAARAFRLAFLSSFLLVALAGALLWLVWGMQAPSAVHHAGASASVGLPPVSPAEHLYQAIGLAMSLYDLDQAAGGTGRVIRGTDPHFLLLSYDYPTQSVRVSLNRTDVTSGDYRVQAVALYHGKTLLQRRAQMD